MRQAFFAGDLFRMYSRLSEREGWNMEVIDIKQSEQGGIKEVVAKLNGKSVFKVLKFESGVHRVQRVPETESQGESIHQLVRSNFCQKLKKYKILILIKTILG